jgi:HNH endonuclease
MNAFYADVAMRANYVCEYCHAPQSTSNFPLEVEHIIPISLGGETEFKNLALSCRSCNIFKSNFLFGLDGVRLFNPRTDLWSEHFEVDLITFEIVGLTDIGRGTINRLRMNSTFQLLARVEWNRIDRFP